MSWEERESRFEKHPVRSSFSAGLWVILLIIGFAAFGGIGAWALNLASQPGRIVSKTLDADNVIYNYEWFRQQYQDVLAMDGKIQVQVDAAAAATNEAERTRINSVVAGLRTKRAQMVADYNARGSMANRSIFTAGLPQQIQ